MAGRVHRSISVMKASRLRRRRAGLAVLLCGLVLLASAERRLAYLDFDTDGHVRIENNEKADGNEIINRLIVGGDAKEPIAPTAYDVCVTTIDPIDSWLRSLVVVRLSESRAPPLALSPQA